MCVGKATRERIIVIIKRTQAKEKETTAMYHQINPRGGHEKASSAPLPKERHMIRSAIGKVM